MMKKLIALTVLAVLLAAPLSCLGETVSIQTIVEYKNAINAVENTDYVIITDKHSTLRGVFHTDGEQLTDYLFSHLSYLSNDFFLGYEEADVNNRALVHATGGTVIPAGYGAFRIVNRNWVLGYVLGEVVTEDTELPENTITYTRDKVVYVLERLDLFYLADPSKEAKLVGSLSPKEYASAAAHGKYIAIADQEGVITLYDQDFKAYDYTMAKVDSLVYDVVDYEVMNKATGEPVRDGYVSLKEQMMGNDLVLVVSRYNFKGEVVSGIIDLQGNDIVPLLDYQITSVIGDWAVVTKGKLKGLYSLSQQKLVVPVEFNNIMSGKGTVDKYVFHGYVAVENGNLRGYYDIAAGKLSCEIKYDTKAVTTMGCTTYWKTEEGTYILAAADGVETEVQVDSIKGRGDGRLLVATKDGYNGVIDWHGNVILPFEHKNAITITDDSKAVIRSSTGYELDAILYAE